MTATLRRTGTDEMRRWSSKEGALKLRAILMAGLAFGSAAWAQFGAAHVDQYDPTTGLYFKSITDKPGHSAAPAFSSRPAGSPVINLNIFDPATSTSVTLFKQPPPGPIVMVLFETRFKDGAVEFDSPLQFGHVLNNTGVEPRALKDKLLIGLGDEKGNVVSLWTSDKHGNGLAQVAALPENADWHIDVRNSRIRVVRQVGQSIKIESYVW